MSNVCRAKDPSACRVHGTGGKIDELQTIADEAAVIGDMNLYFQTRAEIDSLSDETNETFIAPDTGNLIADNWKDNEGNLLPESPNDMLLSLVRQSSYNETSDTKKARDVLSNRGYSEKDLLLTKHFRFKKDDLSSKYSEFGHMDPFHACREIEAKHNKQITNDEKTAFIDGRFDQFMRELGATKQQCEEFIDDYENLLLSR